MTPIEDKYALFKQYLGLFTDLPPDELARRYQAFSPIFGLSDLAFGFLPENVAYTERRLDAWHKAIYRAFGRVPNRIVVLSQRSPLAQSSADNVAYAEGINQRVGHSLRKIVDQRRPSDDDCETQSNHLAIQMWLAPGLHRNLSQAAAHGDLCPGLIDVILDADLVLAQVLFDELCRPDGDWRDIIDLMTLQLSATLIGEDEGDPGTFLVLAH